MHKPNHVIFTWLLALALGASARAEEIRDYYSEPGLNPFKETLNQDLNEHIDPFSGTLQHKYIDVYIPGNGGMDLKVSRVYTSPQEHLGVRTVTGVGWTMHFGRLVVPTAHKDKLCAQDLYSVHTQDNPSIEFPDGGRELLVLDAVHGGYLITRSAWRARCNGSDEGLIVTAPNGTVYTMNALNTLNNHWSWYTTRIEDRHGNVIEIAYKTNPWNFIYIDTVTSSDGRTAKFTYLDETSLHIRLETITANGQTWAYRYEPVASPEATNYYHLTEVIRPDGLRWRYHYNPYDSSMHAAGNYALKAVTNPYGANILYTYQRVDFTPADAFDDKTTAVATKVVSDHPPGGSATGGSASLSGGSWTFEFVPNSPELFPTEEGNWVSGLDKTMVRMPGGIQVYYHYGYSYTSSLSSSILWLTGMLYKHETWEGCTGPTCAVVPTTRLETIYNSWKPRLISYENFWHGRSAFEEDTYAPVLTRRVHQRNDSGNETRYEEHDEFGHPRRIVESSNIVGDPDRITELSYHIDREKWILNLVEDETIRKPNGEVVSRIDRTFDKNGNLIAEDENGVLTTYSYTAEGDLATVTDARGNTTSYSDYHRGIAQVEHRPESVTLSRVVSDTGTVASETNGRGLSRSYAYDGMNRLTGITYPIHAPVSIVWDDSGKTLSRGSYVERVELDGFGRVVSTSRNDTARGVSITRTVQYDVHGNKVFESYPNSEAGVRYAHDLLKRVTVLEHFDGALRSYVYDGGKVQETDERGNRTDYLYRSYGAPDKDKVLIEVRAPSNVYTRVNYNLLNLPTWVFQGEVNPSDGTVSGYVRQLSYDSRHFLTEVNDPETGVTRYGRDEVGNMTSRQVGDSGVTAYSYDGLNRLVFIDYPGTTPDVTKRYDADGHLINVTNTDSVLDYSYDENDNLVEQVLTAGDLSYFLTFGYDDHDSLAKLVYPSGRTVEYLPDAFGRPTQATPYVEAVSYHPGGQLAQILHRNGELTDIGLNERQWIAEMAHHQIAELGYEYDALGNVLEITDPLHPEEDRTFGYDGLNRLTSARGRWGEGQFGYDAWGNLRSIALGPDAHSLDYSGLNLYSVTHNGVTRSWYAYDVYGNVLYDTELLGLASTGSLVRQQEYSYDDAGQLRRVQVIGNASGFLSFAAYAFDYDAAGQRMRRTDSDGSVTHFVYGRTGQLLGEYTGSPSYGKEYVYLGSQLIASAQTNQPPKADAGPDQTVEGGQLVTLDGRRSSDSDGFIAGYAWAQTGGTPVTLSGADTSTASFTAPALAINDSLHFELTVTDDLGDTASDTVTITVRGNLPPIADAGPDHTVTAGQVVILDGRGSKDPDGFISSYAWAQTGGTAVVLSGADSATASFTAPTLATTETLAFSLTVTDDKGAQAADGVLVTVEAQASPSDTTPPRTHYRRARTEVEGLPAYTVTLTPNEPASVYLRVTGIGTIVSGAQPTEDWQPYSSMFTVVMREPGTATVEFYAVDVAGNRESVKQKVLRRSR